MEDFCSRLNQAAKKYQNRKGFAVAVGVSQTTITAWLKCKSLPTADHLTKICQRTEVSADWLLGLQDPEKAGREKRSGI